MEFAEAAGNQLIVGDVLVEGFFFLGEGSLVSEYPRDYHAAQVSPAPHELLEDSQTIKWLSVKSFDLAQTNIVFEKSTSGASDFFKEYTAMFVGSIALVGIGSFSLWFF